jgi:hypothetical protein
MIEVVLKDKHFSDISVLSEDFLEAMTRKERVIKSDTF